MNHQGKSEKVFEKFQGGVVLKKEKQTNRGNVLKNNYEKGRHENAYEWTEIMGWTDFEKRKCFSEELWREK